MSTTETASDDVFVPLDELHAIAVRVLRGMGMSEAHAQAVARVIVAGQRDACASHGVYRLISIQQTVRAGKVDLKVEPTIVADGSPVVRVDAHYGISLLGFERGLPKLVEAASKHGLAAMAINHCFHFSALWPEVEAITAQGLAAFVLTPSHAWVAPAGGRKPVFGTNPIAFGWPRPPSSSPYPFVFDFATSAIARGDLELHRRAGTPLPPGSGVDAQGKPSTDPVAVANGGAMLPFGGHKGSALSAMVELMAGALIGDWTSRESQAFDEGRGGLPCHGELIMAFDLNKLGGGAQGAAAGSQARAEDFFGAYIDSGARLPSQRRFAAREQSLRHGARIPRKLFDEISALTV